MTATAAGLLPAQRLKWDAYKQDPTNPSNNVGLLLHLDGELDGVRLETALRAIQDAQPALRATFEDGPGSVPVQWLHPRAEFVLRHADVQSRAEPRNAAQQLADAMIREPFDLGRIGLLRALLIRLGAAEHLLAIALPNAAADGPSIGVLSAAVARNYELLADGGELPADEYTAEYLACCAGRADAADPGGETVAEYAAWIAGVPRLDLPPDHRVPRPRSGAGAEIKLDLDQDDVDAIAAAARLRRTSQSPLLFGAFASALGARSGQDRFLLNVFVSGRSKPEEQHLIGRFANRLPLPIDLAGELTPAEMADRASRTWWRSFSFHDTPVPVLLERTGTTTPVGHLPFCDVTFVLNDGGTVPPASGGLRLRTEREPSRIAPSDLTLFTGTSANGRFEIRLEYSTDLYRESTALALLAEYLAVLAALCGDHELRAAAELRNRVREMGSAA